MPTSPYQWNVPRSATLYVGDVGFCEAPIKLLRGLKPFVENPAQLVTGYHVKCTDATDAVRDLMKSLKGETVVGNDHRSGVLGLLCEEFGFRKLKRDIDSAALVETWCTVTLERCFAQELLQEPADNDVDEEEYALDVNNLLN